MGAHHTPFAADLEEGVENPVMLRREPKWNPF